MKILIVPPSFPPHNAISALRAYSWAKYWGRLGHEITVYTIRHYGIVSNIDINLKNVKVHEVSIPFIQSFVAKHGGTKESTGLLRKKKTIKQKIIGIIRNIYKNAVGSSGCVMGVRYPDIREMWAKNVVRKVKLNKFDMVITSGCPYPVHLVGLALKKKYPDIFWIVDWRDLWTQNPNYNGLRIFHPHEKRLEKKIHAQCDLITTVSEGFAEDLRRITPAHVEIVYNGFDSEDHSELLKHPRKKNNRFTAAFVGSLYKAYNFVPLLTALSELDKEGKITPDHLEIVFAGINCNIEESVNKFGLQKYYSYLGFLPREKSLDIQYNADAVLLFGMEKTKGVLPAKIYEYFSLANEIWSTGTTNKTEADVLIEKTNTGVFLGTDIEKTKSLITERITAKNTGEIKKDFKLISTFERKNQAEKMLSLYYSAKSDLNNGKL